MKGRTPTRAEKEHMDRVRDLGCIICRQQGKGRRPCEIQHVYGKTKKDAHGMRYRGNVKPNGMCCCQGRMFRLKEQHV